jgi:hypothetical protein
LASLGVITLNELEIHEIDVDPRTSGIDAPIGSLAILTDGSFIFLKTTVSTTGWNPITPLTFLEYSYRQTAANQTSTSTTYAPVTELTSASLPAGTYKFEVLAICQSTAVATGVGVRVGAGTATITSLFASWNIGQAVNGTDKYFQYDQITPTDNITATATATANTNFLVTAQGTLTTSTAGTVSVQLRSETGTAVSTRIGSIFFLKRIA